MTLRKKHLLSIKDCLSDEIETIIKTAKDFKYKRKAVALKSVVLGNLFFEPSTRTRISFEIAARKLSATVVNFTSTGSSIEKGESILDTAKNLISMGVNMIVLRHRAVGSALFISERVNVPVINGGDGTNEHPTQALLDLFTAIEEFGTVKNLNVLIAGDILHSRVAFSNIFAFKKMGSRVGVCGPPAFIPEALKFNEISLFYDLKEGLKWADLAIFLRVQKERGAIYSIPSLREYTLFYQLNEHILEEVSKPGLKIMHPGPVNKNVELTEVVAESPVSLILKQVENGIYIRMAVIYLLALNWNYA